MSFAWDLELTGQTPVLKLPPWLPPLEACAAVHAMNATSPALHFLLTSRSAECTGQWLPCFTGSRRGCNAASANSKLQHSTEGLTFAERFLQRPDRPISAAPFWRVASYTAALLQPHEEFEKLVLRPSLSPFASMTPRLAVHLRYGDSCSAFEQNRTARRCSPVKRYVEAALRMHARYDFRSVVIASDSARAQAEFEAQWSGRTPVFTSGPRAHGLGIHAAAQTCQ